MAHVPTDSEIDAMSEEELDAYLASAEPQTSEIYRPSGPTRATGASRSYGLTLVIGAVIAIAACWELMASELALIKDPLTNLSCDINPLVSCGASLDVWQGNLLGVPNSFVGAMAFAVVLVLGMLLVAGVRLPRWTWRGLSIGCLGGVGFVAWFLSVSITALGKLCPFCMVIWAVTIPVATSTWAEAAMGGHLGLSVSAGRRLYAARWWIAAAMYLAVLVVVLVAFWDGWMSLLR